MKCLLISSSLKEITSYLRHHPTGKALYVSNTISKLDVDYLISSDERVLPLLSIFNPLCVRSFNDLMSQTDQELSKLYGTTLFNWGHLCEGGFYSQSVLNYAIIESSPPFMSLRLK